MAMSREDFRTDNQLRPLAIELGLISDSQGSAKVSVGRTSAVASIFGPSQPRFSRLEVFDKATLEVDFSCPSMGIQSISGNTSEQTRREKRLGEIVQRALSSSCDLSQFPRMTILVQVAVITDDGSALSAALAAASLALLNSSVPMRWTPLAVTLAVHRFSPPPPPSSSSSSPSTSRYLLDPTSSEEVDGAAVVNVILSNQPAPDGSMSTLACEVDGGVSADELQAVTQRAAAASLLWIEFYRQAVGASLS